MKRDYIVQSLNQEQDCDPTTEVFLRVISPAIAVLCQRFFKDRVSGSVHTQLDTTDPVVRQKYQCVP